MIFTSTRKDFKLGVIIFLIMVLVMGILQSYNVSALSGSNFRAGRIIDDSIFYNGNTMSTQEIQGFLNAKVPVCDTSGSLMRGSVTRAAHGTANGYPPPYICLKDYTQNTPSKAADNYCSAYGGGTKSAAQIIRDVGVACNISQKSMIVLLQKEQSLITDDWPWSIQYRSATGYGCPDTAPCDAEYYGFFNQVYNAARQFQRYRIQSNLFNYQAGQTSYVQYNPNAGCGGTNVFIENAATAGLYNYTPYQPNASALANLYGSGDSCGAYGNRNFWRIHNDWFGNTVLNCSNNEVASTEVVRSYNPTTYKHFYSGYSCEVSALQFNNGYQTQGKVFSQTTADSPSAVVVHRLYNPRTNLHLWSTTQEDINNATQNAGFRYEGVAFYAVKPTVPGHIAVHRLYNPKTYLHLWSTTQEDINNATKNAGYRYEGVAFYANP